MRRGPEEVFGGFHDRLGNGRMRMDGKFEVRGKSAHFDRKNAFRYQFARADTNDTHP